MSSDHQVLRSILLPAQPFKGEFKLNGPQWLGMTPTAQGAVLLVSVYEPKEVAPTSSLLNAQGQRLLPQAPEAPTWEMVCSPDGAEDPGPDWQWLGGIAANAPNGQLTGLFYFARLKP